jgi:hypothetical protein
VPRCRRLRRTRVSFNDNGQRRGRQQSLLHNRLTRRRHPVLRPLGTETSSSASCGGPAEFDFLAEATTGFEPVIAVLQTAALPLGYVAWELADSSPSVAEDRQAELRQVELRALPDADANEQQPVTDVGAGKLIA